MEELFRKYLDGRCSDEELALLLSYFRKSENEIRLRELIREGLEKTSDNEGEENWSVVTEQTLKNILQQINAESTRTIPFYRRYWVRVAASLLIILSVGAYFFYPSQKKSEGPTRAIEQIANVPDLLPGDNKAVLILADGSQVVLDSAGNGIIAQQGSVQIQLQDGQILYSGSGSKIDPIQYNTVSTPRGGQYQLVLSDGTKVWLNAESSLRYPAHFPGTERKVYLTGEGYFEVAKNNVPFRVDIDSRSTVEVMGTHFNVNAYREELSLNTTLLEGRVKVISQVSSAALELSPGQQSRLSQNGQIELNRSPNIEDVMAWKNGKFQFGEASDIKSIMNQISRWYDVDVVYEGEVTDHIGGTISRDVKASKVFEMLEMTGSVKFKIEGKKVIVMPQKR
jgi:ferric-dicitrate binding protein FerR (iron transport regulator)